MDTPSNVQSNGNGKKSFKPVPMAILGIVVVVGLIYGIPKYQYMKRHATTDNAYLTANITQIAPQVAGQVKEILVSENQAVKKGDLLVQIDDAKYKAAVQQAEANLHAAIADAKAAGINVSITEATASAQVVQSEGGVDQSSGAIGSAEADVLRSKAAVSAAKSSEDKQKADIETQKLDIEVANDGYIKAQRAVDSATAQVASAKAAYLSAKASASAAKAKADQTERDAKRIGSLAESGAVSKQQKENADLAFATAYEQLRSANYQAEAAQAAIAQRDADLQSAKQQLNIASATLRQARSRLRASNSYSKALSAQTAAALSQKMAAVQAVNQAKGKLKQAKGLLDQAKTAPDQISAKQAAKEQALAKVELAKATLANAKLDMEHTRIVAPIDGKISKKSVQLGALVAIGTPLMALVEDNSLTIYANFKETQIKSIKPGMKVEIEVDSYPGYKFKGKVDSMSAATGATFALLPPDNATGNFVKVVQRVPVKIKFDESQEGMDLLKAGLSAVVSVELSD